MEVCEQKNKVSNADIITTLSKKEKLSLTPGQRHQYSNSGYVLLSEIIQRVTRQEFPDFIREEIFNKVGMNDSWIFSDKNEKKIKNRALGYGEWPYFELKDSSPCNYNYGDGGVYTSLSDYKKWIDTIEKGTFLKPEFQKRMFTPGKLDDGESTNYAYGW